MRSPKLKTLTPSLRFSLPPHRIASGLAWLSILFETGFVSLMLWSTLETKSTSDSTQVGWEILQTPSIKKYICLACIPFSRVFGFSVLFSNSEEHYGLRENTAMLILCIGHIIRAKSNDSHGHVDDFQPAYRKVLSFLVDIVLFYSFNKVRKRVSQTLTISEKEDFVYNLLPTVIVGIIVPLAYLVSETASCWGQNWNVDDPASVCHDIFVANDALSVAFLGAGFVYLITKPFFFKSYSMVNLVSFNFHSFRTYIQIVVFITSMYSALYLFSKSNEITGYSFVPGDMDANLEYYFELKLGTFHITQAEKMQVISYVIHLTFFLLTVSVALFENQGQPSSDQQAGELSSSETVRSSQRPPFKLSRYLRSKLMTLKSNELAPFYRYWSLMMLAIFIFEKYKEVMYRRRLFGVLWDHFRIYRDDICEGIDKGPRPHLTDDDCLKLPDDTIYSLTEYNDHLCDYFSCDAPYKTDPAKFYETEVYEHIWIKFSQNMVWLMWIGLLVLSRVSVVCARSKAKMWSESAATSATNVLLY